MTILRPLRTWSGINTEYVQCPFNVQFLFNVLHLLKFTGVLTEAGNKLKVLFLLMWDFVDLILIFNLVLD